MQNTTRSPQWNRTTNAGVKVLCLTVWLKGCKSVVGFDTHIDVCPNVSFILNYTPTHKEVNQTSDLRLDGDNLDLSFPLCACLYGVLPLKLSVLLEKGKKYESILKGMGLPLQS